MSNPLVTVIIPIYNVEDYLEKCVESVLNQTYKNIEIILVDDGATDRSGMVCDELQARDNRIKVIHKANGGLADARNAAINVMTGEYVTCIDSDDWVSEDYISYLLSLLLDNDCDISMVQLKKIYKVTDEFDQVEEKVEIINKVNAIEFYLYQKKFTASAHCKMYKSSILQEIRYPKGMYYEDMAVICQLLDMSDRVAVSNQQKYYYFQRETSIMGESFNEKKMHRIKIAKDIFIFIKIKYPELIDAAKFRIFLAAAQTYREIPYKDEYASYIDVAWADIKKYRAGVIRNSKAKASSRLIAMSSFLGKRIFNWLGDLYTKVKS